MHAPEVAADAASHGGRAPRAAWRRNGFRAVIIAVGALALSAAQSAAQIVTVGGKAFTEQYVMAEITKQLLEKNGIEAVTRVGYATDAIRQAQLAGEVDISWDYTWTGYAFHHGFDEYKPADEIMEILRDIDADNGLVWLQRSSVNNTYALAANLDFAAEACIHSLQEVSRAIRNGVTLRLASDQECHKREDCLLRAQRVYGFEIPTENIEVMNVSDTYEALRERRAEIAVVYTTDGKIPAYDLELLEDSEGVFAEYFLVPVARADLLERDPRIGRLLERVALSMDTQTQQDLHYRIDVVGQSVEEVARYYITLKGL